MATPTLPHPNMDFTPLDILTAAEMDKMVANDQYLRDFCAGLANGTNIENGVIQLSQLIIKIQSGDSAVIFQADNTGGGFTTVNFPTQFQNTPSVIATPDLSNGRLASVMITSVSRGSFTYLARTQGPNVTGKIRWIAVSLNG